MAAVHVLGGMVHHSRGALLRCVWCPSGTHPTHAGHVWAAPARVSSLEGCCSGVVVLHPCRAHPPCSFPPGHWRRDCSSGAGTGLASQTRAPTPRNARTHVSPCERGPARDTWAPRGNQGHTHGRTQRRTHTQTCTCMGAGEGGTGLSARRRCGWRQRGAQAAPGSAGLAARRTPERRQGGRSFPPRRPFGPVRSNAAAHAYGLSRSRRGTPHTHTHRCVSGTTQVARQQFEHWAVRNEGNKAGTGTGGGAGAVSSHRREHLCASPSRQRSAPPPTLAPASRECGSPAGVAHHAHDAHGKRDGRRQFGSACSTPPAELRPTSRSRSPTQGTWRRCRATAARQRAATPVRTNKLAAATQWPRDLAPPSVTAAKPPAQEFMQTSQNYRCGALSADTHSPRLPPHPALCVRVCARVRGPATRGASHGGGAAVRGT